jgi:lysozyme
MKMSERGRQLLTQWEGFRTSVYNDAAGLKTIGVGHLITRDELSSGEIIIGSKPVRYKTGLTEEQVGALLAHDLQKFEDAVMRAVKVPLEQNQFDALVSFAFNVGVEAFNNSTVLKALNAGKFADVPDELRRWTTAGGSNVPGLVTRRENEIKLWFGAI